MERKIEVPVRTSSKQALETERDALSFNIKTELKKLKPRASCTSEFWSRAALIAGMEQDRAQVVKKISIEDFAGHKAVWKDTAKAKDLFTQMKAAKVQENLYTRHADRLETEGNANRKQRKYCMDLFTTRTLGSGIKKVGMGRRNTSDQSQFRADCIAAYNVRETDPNSSTLWCPVTRTWVDEMTTTAAHIFAYSHGQSIMNAIFGETEQPELFSPLNGLILSTHVEQMLDEGVIAIVPQLPNEPSLEEIKVWNSTEPKAYKIRILDAKSKLLDKYVPFNAPNVPDKTQWRDHLDGKPLQFRNDFRPRARYLYFLYCIQMLKMAWNDECKGHEKLAKEMRKYYWGTPGQYLPKNMLLAIVEEIGHNYDRLLEGAMEDDEKTGKGESEIESNLLLAVGINQIKATVGKKKAEEENSESEDESEDESENGGENDNEAEIEGKGRNANKNKNENNKNPFGLYILKY